MDFKLNQKGYIINHKGEIESLTYREYLETFGSDETTTPGGVAPRLYVDGNTLMTWGVRGNNNAVYRYCETKTEAKNLLYEIFEQNVGDNCDYVYFATSKKELYTYLAECYNKGFDVVKRYFKILDAQIEKTRLLKIKHDNRPFTTIEMMRLFIGSNKEMISTSLNELNELKQAENKQLWQIKANSLVQKVCNNDFRTLNWKEVYNLTKESLKN